MVAGCSSNTDGNEISGNSIYDESISESSLETIEQIRGEIESEEIAKEPAIIEISPKNEDFEFGPAIMVAAGNGIEFSLSSMEHEIKGENWGKITHIVSTVYNKNASAFKPKAIIRLHDSKDPKAEWFKPKAEFDYGIEKLNQGEHATADVFVNIAFDDISISKRFEMVVVDGQFDNHRSIAAFEMEFYPTS